MSALKSTREFLLEEKIGSLKDKIYIYNSNQEKLGYFQGKLIKIGNTFRLYDINDTPLYTISEKMVSMRSTYEFFKGGEKDDDKLLGKLKQKLVSIRPKFYFEDPDGEEIYEAKGKVYRLKYDIEKDGDTVAEISQKILKSIIQDSYGVRIDKGVSDEEAMIILGMVVMLHHEKEEND